MAHYDEYFSERETVDINRREKIDFVVDLVIEDYKYKQIWGR